MRAKLSSSGLTGTVVLADSFQYKIRLDRPQAGATFVFWPREHCLITDLTLPKVRGVLPTGPWGPIPRKPRDRAASRARRDALLSALRVPRSWQYLPQPTKQGRA